MTDLHPFGVNNMAGNCRWQNDGNVVGGGGGENKYDEEIESELERETLAEVFGRYPYSSG